MILGKIILLLTVLSQLSTSNGGLLPTIVMNSNSVLYYRLNESVSLEYFVTGSPPLTFEWIKNGVSFTENNNQSQILTLTDANSGSFLLRLIDNAERGDQGDYQCVVTNPYGTALSDITLLRLAILETSYSGEIQVVNVTEGKPFRLLTKPYLSAPNTTFQWDLARSIEDDKPTKLKLDKRIQMDITGILKFAYATKKDSLNGGIYRLYVTNDYFDYAIAVSYTKVIVQDGNSEEFAPVFSYGRSIYIGWVGQNLTMFCFFSANPEADHTWQTPGIQQPEFNKENTRIFIRNITRSHEGNYTCSASNKLGTSERNIKLLVYWLPKFLQATDRPQDKEAIEGETVTFTCDADAMPPAKSVWYTNAVMLNPNSMPSRMSLNPSGTTLTIENVCRDCRDDDRTTDEMVIQCKASNTWDPALLASAHLTISDGSN